MAANFLQCLPVPFLRLFERLLADFVAGRQHPVDEYTIWGARYGGKTFSYNWLIMCALGANLAVTFYVYRYFKGDVNKSIFNQLLDRIYELGWEHECDINRSAFSIKRGKTSIYCSGIHGIRTEWDAKSGKGNKMNKFFSTPYAVLIFEECDEMVRDEMVSVITATRPLTEGQLIIINCGNPLHAQNDFSQFVEANFPFDFAAVEKHAAIQKMVDDDGYKHLFIRYSIEANPFALENKNVRQNILKWRDINPKKYEAWYWGRPVIFTGNVFSHLIRHIDSVPLKKINQSRGKFLAGVDFGYVRNQFASLLMFLNHHQQLVILKEFYISPQDEDRNTDVITRHYMKWWMEAARDYPELLHQKIMVQADNENYLYIEKLNRLAMEYQFSWLEFEATSKPAVNSRVSYLQNLLSDEKIFTVEGEIYHFINELEMAEYDQKSRTDRLVKKDDHLIDSFFYGISREIGILI